MLRILGSRRRLCDGRTRREFLEVGGLSACGLGLGALLAAERGNAVRAATSSPASSVPGFGRAKRCILLYLYGAWSQLETFDMKPLAPVEIRGSMRPIPSALPGLDVCELLPHTAKITDRLSIIRSVTHPYPIHGVAYATTGVPAIDVAMELAPHDPRHQPYFGTAVEYFDRRARGGRIPTVPQNVALPFPFSTQRTGEVHRAGPYGAYLGSEYGPVWTEFDGKASGTVKKTLRDMQVDVPDPYVGCTSESTFRFAAASPAPGLTLDRLDRRRSLLTQFEGARRDLDRTHAGRSLGTFREQALSLIASPETAAALDVRREPPETLDLYGPTLFGRGCLAARRMLEAGTRLASVFWDEFGLAGDAWDTHWNHFPRMTEQLLPPFDRAFSGLIVDLERRGMLDDTLVAVLSDHGRTPKINKAAGGGRDHWSRAYTLVLAGAGVGRGRVIGATDAHASDVVQRPVSPKSVLATMYHLLGIDPHAAIPDRTGRPIPLVPDDAGPIPEVLA